MQPLHQYFGLPDYRAGKLEYQANLQTYPHSPMYRLERAWLAIADGRAGLVLPVRRHQKHQVYIEELELMEQKIVVDGLCLLELLQDFAARSDEEILAQAKHLNVVREALAVVGAQEMTPELAARYPPVPRYSSLVQSHILHLIQPRSNLGRTYRKLPTASLLKRRVPRPFVWCNRRVREHD